MDPYSTASSRVGVLFVHGVGNAAHSDTLIDFGRSFFGWVARWQQAQGVAPKYGTAELNYLPFDAGTDHPISHAELHLPATPERPDPPTWVCAEAWWDSSVRPMPFTEMIWWSIRYLLTLLSYLASPLTILDRLRRLAPGGGSVHDGGYLYRLVDGLTLLGHFVGYVILEPLGYALLLPLAVAAQIPYDPIRNFAVVTLARTILQYNASQLRVYYEDEIQAANMRRRVADGVAWLTQPAEHGGGGCESVVIIAHSGGVWIAHGMLSDETYEWARRRVRKFISLGAGLNKIWEIAPSVERLYKPIKGNVYWLDFWSSYDPVPAGWLQPPRVGPPDWRSIVLSSLDCRPWRCIYDPDPTVAHRHGLEKRVNPLPPFRSVASTGSDSTTADPADEGVYWPESVRVVNRMDALTDHGGYFSNDEEVLRRVAAEIDAEVYSESIFWPGDDVVDPAIRSRRTRVAVLASARIIGLIIGVLAGREWGTTVAEYVAGIGPIASVLSGAQEVLHGLVLLPLVGAFLGLAWTWLVVFLLWVAGASIASLVGLVPYEMFRALWEQYDQGARDTLLRARRTLRSGCADSGGGDR